MPASVGKPAHWVRGWNFVRGVVVVRALRGGRHRKRGDQQEDDGESKTGCGRRSPTGRGYKSCRDGRVFRTEDLKRRRFHFFFRLPKSARLERGNSEWGEGWTAA